MPIICVSQGGGNSWQGHGKRTYVFFFGGALALARLEGFWDLDLPLLFAFDLALLHHLVIIIIALLIQIDLTGIRVVWGRRVGWIRWGWSSVWAGVAIEINDMTAKVFD